MRINTTLIKNVKAGNVQLSRILLGSGVFVWNYFDNFDLDYQAIIAQAAIRGFTLPSIEQQILQDEFLKTLKSIGVWSKLDVLYVFAHNGSAGFGTINWKSPFTAGATLANSPIFYPNIGFGTDGITARIDTPFQFNTSGVNYTLNNCSLGYFNPVTTGSPQSPIGVSTVANSTNIVAAASLTQVRLNSGSNIANTATLGSVRDYVGMISAHRTSSTAVRLYADTQSEDLTITSTALSTGNLSFLRRGVTYSGVDQRVSMGFVGSSMLSEAAAFNTAAKAYMGGL